MARNKVVQVPCDAELYAKIAAYRDEKNLEKDAAAARELMLFALRILDHSDKDEGISTRELLEVMLENVLKIHYQTTSNHYQNYNDERYHLNIKADNVVPSYKKLMALAEDRTKQILEGAINK
ncbi:hypothetical protein [Shewanella colwelliana]|uniref:hypothetical protein n=1 Tax=Shewanella colwelliana TaxID=23 RepID=UPI00373549CF